MMTQMNLFQKASDQPRYFALLELHEEKAYTAEELLEELEPYTGPLDLEQMIPAKVCFLVPNSTFFFMDVTEAVAS